MHRQVRMTLHEADKTVQRYAVPDVLEPGLDATLVEWESITPEGRYGPTRLITGDAQLLVQHEPFALTMTVRGKVVLVLNDRQLLHMEHQHASRQVCLLARLLASSAFLTLRRRPYTCAALHMLADALLSRATLAVPGFRCETQRMRTRIENVHGDCQPYSALSRVHLS
jgi:hypothetical protein